MMFREQRKCSLEIIQPTHLLARIVFASYVHKTQHTKYQRDQRYNVGVTDV